MGTFGKRLKIVFYQIKSKNKLGIIYQHYWKYNYFHMFLSIMLPIMPFIEFKEQGLMNIFCDGMLLEELEN